ncbi:MAG: HEAT repeat domain-containing protein, partial [Phycisphaerae bacterium]
ELLRDERGYLVTSLREALNHYESHHRPEVLEASMLLADELESSLFEQSTVKRGKLTHAMIEVISDWLSPRFVPFLYVAIACPELRRRIVPRLSGCRDPAFFAEFIRWNWLARDPAIRKHLVSIRSIAWLNDGFDAIFNLPADVASMAPTWILALGLPSNQKVSLLMNLLVVDNPRANRSAAWGLVDIKTPASTVALESLLDHEDPSVQYVVKLELEYRRRTGQLAKKRKSTIKGRPEEWVNLLDRANLTEDFDAFWQHFEHIHPTQARSAGSSVFKYIPGFTTQVQIRLLSQKPADRLRALRLMKVLCISEHFQRDVFAISNDKLPEIRAAAMTTLGQIGGETARRILLRALSDEAAVVQTAGIDALDAMNARDRDRLVAPMTSSTDADVRAAAVRCLLRMRVPQAAVSLMSMLTDPNADHRCAALWIVDRLKLFTLSSRIQTMAQCDPDRRIARIASHVSRRLERASAGAAPHSLSQVSS